MSVYTFQCSAVNLQPHVCKARALPLSCTTSPDQILNTGFKYLKWSGGIQLSDRALASPV